MRHALVRALPFLLFLLAGAAQAGDVLVTRIDGGINPAVAAHVEEALARAKADGATLVVLELDTPGGLLEATRDIVSELLNAELPVAVFVAPKGAWAASAGTFITLAGHVAAMAPGSTIGAAHPVSIGGSNPKPPEPGESADPNLPARSTHSDYMDEKIENFTAAFIESIAQERARNVEWAVDAVRHSVAIRASEALEKNVIDLIADDLDDLLAKLDGRSVRVGKREVVLATKDARVVRFEMNLTNRIFAVLADPQIVGLLFLVGVVALYIELQNPGLILPGAVGVGCLITAALAMQIIPFNWAGVVLVLAGIALLIAEIHIVSFGVLFALGIAALSWGAYLVFRVPELSDLAIPFWRAIAPAVFVISAAFAAIGYSIQRSLARPAYAGVEALALEIGVAETDFVANGEGRVRVRSELWRAVAEAPIARGERIRVVSVLDLVLYVRRADEREQA